jgi:D-beta-D-heptose 7-phosphate kinase / D-beta-D-heptose 1-phosphate adenosyltransferase
MIDLQNKSPKVLVIGDLIVDKYLWGSCQRISPEAPVQVVNVHQDIEVLGGAGNVVNNLKMLGAKVDLISVVGSCDTSNELIKLLKGINVKTGYLVNQKNRKSSKKTRIIASHQQVLRYDYESSEKIDSNSQNLIIQTYKKIVNDYDIVLLSDYGKGVLTRKLTQYLINTAKEYDKKVLIDPKGSDYLKYKGAYLLTPNKVEASMASKINIDDDASLARAIKEIKLQCDLEFSLVTLSENGIAVYDNEMRIHPTIAKEVFDVTGAGDTVLASLGFAIACGHNIDDAIKFSNLAGGVVVGKIGSSAATLNEIMEYESKLNKSFSKTHIKTSNEIIRIIKELKLKDKKIVFTNGCFDLLHAGHISYLESAKKSGDILIVGLNSDRSVSSLKGSDRPINSEADRAYILSALEVVDYVVIFDEDTPYELIKSIQPDTLVKGGDYQGQDVVGQDIANELKIIKLVDGKSSSKIIEKIKQ